MKCFYISAFYFLIYTCSYGQSPSTLEKLIDESNRKYPANKAASFRTIAAETQSNIIKNQFKPQLQAAYQLNYATYNNITGMVFPSFITPISGPPAITDNYNGVFGSAAAFLAKWDVATFGYERSLLQQANTQVSLFKAKEQLQQFRLNVQLSSTYLDWLLANKLINIYENNTNRVLGAFNISQTLTQKGLRPGTDSASWSSEYAKARVLFEQQRKSARTLFIQVQQLIGVDTAFTASDTIFLSQLPVLIQNANSLHPELQVLQKEIDDRKTQINTIQQSKKPLLSLYGTAYARGSGAETTNDIKAFQGLYFQRYNYGVGAQLSVPLFEGARTKMKVLQQQQLVNAASGDYGLMQWQLQEEIEKAGTTLQIAVGIIALTRSQVQSSNFLFNAVTARYKAGLVSYADVLLAQQQLIQAEEDLEKAKWEVWKAVLYKASVLGDLKFFTQQFK